MTRAEFKQLFRHASEDTLRLSCDAEPVTVGPPAEFITSGPAAEREAGLHSEIMAECVRRGWKAFHGSMIHVSRRTPSEPDFTIAADRGRTFYVECKSKDGKLSVGQQAVFAQLRKLGHEPLLVRSLEEFKRFVDGEELRYVKPEKEAKA